MTLVFAVAPEATSVLIPSTVVGVLDSTLSWGDLSFALGGLATIVAFVIWSGRTKRD